MSEINNGLKMQCKVNIVASNDKGILDEIEEIIDIDLMEMLSNIFKKGEKE